MHTDLATLCVGPQSSVHEAMAQIEKSRLGIVLVVDAEGKLLGTITDGDLRRAMLAGAGLDQSLEQLLAAKRSSPRATPVTAPVDSQSSTLLELLRRHNIVHLPLVDSEGRVVALSTLDEFVPQQPLPLQAVIMAGGAGSRLRPLTEDLPKPMLPIGDRPLMEITVQQLKAAGISFVNVAVHHKSEKITEHFGDGKGFGVDIKYVTEDRPLGTAGALGLMDTPQETLLVINGDILTQVDFRAMLAYHREHGADLTVAVHQHHLQLPYGVIECDGPTVTGLSEKPLLRFFINAGIYLLEPAVCSYIPAGERYDMTELIQRLMDEGRPVQAFPVSEYWIDVGQHAEYQKAQEDVKSWSR